MPEWQAIHDGLADEESRQTLRDLLGFRLSADPECMRGYSVRLAEQYFEDFMHYTGEVFVDAGGYDGDTTEAFAARYPDYRKVLFFEPSARNMAAARARLAQLRDVEFFPSACPMRGNSCASTRQAGRRPLFRNPAASRSAATLSMRWWKSPFPSSKWIWRAGKCLPCAVRAGT